MCSCCFEKIGPAQQAPQTEETTGEADEFHQSSRNVEVVDMALPEIDDLCVVILEVRANLTDVSAENRGISEGADDR